MIKNLIIGYELIHYIQILPRRDKMKNSLPDLEDGEERLLGQFDAADSLHPLLPFPLLLQELPLPREVPRTVISSIAYSPAPGVTAT